MYPLGTSRPWPINQWYVAGFSSELGNAVVARTFLGRRIVMLRDSSGQAQALSGICPHRMMPMEEGKLEGDRLSCGYHGLTFDVHDGKCVQSPTSKRLPECGLVSYPLREVGPLLWIWLGKADQAISNPLPPQQSIGIGREDWVTQCVDYQVLKARYPLLVDNLFDLSHIYYIHYSIIGESGRSTLDEPVIKQHDGRLRVYREVMDCPADHFDHYSFPGAGPRVSKRSETELVNISLINAGTLAVEGPSWDSKHLGYLNFIHVQTPETETTTHYWAMLTRDFRLDDQQYSDEMAKLEMSVIAQDRETLERIERLLQSSADIPREISMRSDTGALRARARIIEMIRAEEAMPC